LCGNDGAELTTLHDVAKAAYSTYWRKMELDETRCHSFGCPSKDAQTTNRDCSIKPNRGSALVMK
jgi:hypothetical protein